MPNISEAEQWPEKIRQRYESYLRTSFFFRDASLRASFLSALQEEGSLLKGPLPEPPRDFKTGASAQDLARECFPEDWRELVPALIERPLYMHQEQAVRHAHAHNRNVVVATGTASGKTESFLYPILFELYRQHLAGELEEPGVRAIILYPMNALANDQRERLGSICDQLEEAGSQFSPTFGQYIGQTPENLRDTWKNAKQREEDRMAGELVFRDEMRETPPHILLTNYSMLEYLLIRPDDSPLFDDGRGKHWQFVVLDEAHQYRGAKGMEMGMLLRRLKQRVRAGGRQAPFRCIATSATLSSSQLQEDRQAVADFATELFGEPFEGSGVIFGESQNVAGGAPRRYHAFLRALEGAFLVHKDGKDVIVLNRRGEGHEPQDGSSSHPGAEPLEIALCRECGQHYYVGQVSGGKLREAIRDPSQRGFGATYYLPTESGDELLCRRCGALSKALTCDCGAEVHVKQCDADKEHADQLKECETCGYQRGGIGDPVQEIVHGSDGPNAVIATALHELLPEDKRRVLAFADSRQEAAFFAWYAEDSYESLRDRNLLLRAIRQERVDPAGLSIDDLGSRLSKEWEKNELFAKADTRESRDRNVLTAILREVLTDERRLSLSGVGLVKWSIQLPSDLHLPDALKPPWNLKEDEARSLVVYLLDEMRRRRAVDLPSGAAAPSWSSVCPWPQWAFCAGSPGKQQHVSQWGGPQSAVVGHFLRRLLAPAGLSDDEKRMASTKLMELVWRTLLDDAADAAEPILVSRKNGTFRLNSRWLRASLATPADVWECDTCATLTTHNVRGICPRNRCPGKLSSVDFDRLKTNHYRVLYENDGLPPRLRAAEHTAQIDGDEARQRQSEFKCGAIHLLSSSTTFEVGVDLGDLDAVFLRNVPPEPFNYAQRVGRAGRRDNPGLALTYCRRNPHDLYHYEDPEQRVIRGTVKPPRLRMTNKKIILRHMVATALSGFFRKNATRFRKVEDFVGDWRKPCAVDDLRTLCTGNRELNQSMEQIVPADMHAQQGIADGSWITMVAGPKSRFADVEAEVCADYVEMDDLVKQLVSERKFSKVKRVGDRMHTIANEPTLSFLSRKAVIPKYGFPVDVVELDARAGDGKPTGVALQRDLSQAIAEYAPGGKVVANKLEWESCGVKVVTGKAWPVRRYKYDDGRDFTQWSEDDGSAPSGAKKYLIPAFGFVTPLFKKPREPRGRTRRLYTTRPFFRGFGEGAEPEENIIFGVNVTKALPGTLVILCEGRNGEGFYICRSCGAHMTGPKGTHKSPSDSKCAGMLESFSLGHELVTDVLRLQFPKMRGEWRAYSTAYAVLLGAAEALDVPDTDLNVTITRGNDPAGAAIVLYDSVPGGAGLVAQLEHEAVFGEVLRNAKGRVQGNCGCDSSCYGCLRSYRNQFAHPHLDRHEALDVLSLGEQRREGAD